MATKKKTTKPKEAPIALTANEATQLNMVKAILDANAKGLHAPDLIEGFMFAMTRIYPKMRINIKVT